MRDIFPLSNKRGFPHPGVVVAMLAVWSSFAAACSTGDSGHRGLDDVVVPSSHALRAIAYETARAWRPDAHLIFVHLEVWPRPEATFGFNSSSDPKVGLNVHIDDPFGNGAARTAEVAADAREVARPSIDLYAEGPLDSVEAFGIAADAGGSAYIRDHPEAWETTWLWNVNLQYMDTGGGDLVVWRVYFTNFETDGYEVLVDPMTGEVLRVTQGP